MCSIKLIHFRASKRTGNIKVNFPDFQAVQLKNPDFKLMIVLNTRFITIKFLSFGTIFIRRIQRIFFLNYVRSNYKTIFYGFAQSSLPVPMTARSKAFRLLRLWVRIPPWAWMFFCCECCVLSGRGLCDGLITRPEESYRMWCVVVCDLETS